VQLQSAIQWEITTMRKLLLACALFLIWPVAASPGPKEDALLVVEQFKKAFDASDVEGVVKLFAPDAVFLGTVSPVLATKTDQIDKYFQGLRQFMPRSITIDEYSTIVVSENAVLFAGMDTFSQTKDGSVIKTPARFTMLITMTGQGWRISVCVPKTLFELMT
jgi:uncharacterized protein (TIGR02246 family)